MCATRTVAVPLQNTEDESDPEVLEMLHPGSRGLG